MRGIEIKGEKQVAIEDFQIPNVLSNQVLIRTKAASICGSDLHFYRSPREELGKRVSYIAGHEGSGIVEKIGENVKNVSPGDRVAIFHRYGCGYCESCRRGWPQYCKTGKTNTMVMGQSVTPILSTGTFSDYILAPDEVCFKIPRFINFEAGSIIGCNGITAFNIIRKVGIKAGDIVVVFGLGPLGITAGLILEKMGVVPIGVELSSERREIAKRLGFRHVVSTIEELKITLNTLSDSTQEVDVALDFTGNNGAINNAIEIVKPLGNVGLVGIGPGLNNTSISPKKFLERGVTISGILVGNILNMFDLIEFTELHKIDFSKIVTNRFKFGEAEKAFSIAEKGSFGKVVLTP